MQDNEIRNLILHYLENHPDAADTLEGIVSWWISRSLLSINREKVQSVIDQLCSEGVLTKKTAASGAQIYSLIRGTKGTGTRGEFKKK